MKRTYIILTGSFFIALLVGAGCSNINSDQSFPTIQNQTPETTNTPSNIEESNDATNTPATTDVSSNTPIFVTSNIDVNLNNSTKPETILFEQTTKSFNITAQQWAFDPNTITVNKGDRVRLTITSVDVEHGFGLPAFDINVNLEPNKTEVIEFVADKSGAFTFFCSVFCGTGHQIMNGQLIVQ